MKARFLVAAAALSVLAGPAWASTPDDATVNPSQGQTRQPAPGQYSGDSYGAFLGTRSQDRDEMRSYERERNNLVPPRMDASGVPDPRV